ncbi:unnamed protein product [Notodromas monacha]|uniref:Uncharacterized protein n=1 Tax=Notodromas monacha TaxID=399045 RepID=A0A7R9BMK8_9CRUS|nr:unnamed protein product [Notodromas monacha]CAG0916777.1 unnamed protein product [Notodromas monacha]
MIKSLAAFLLVAAVCHAAPDKRPQQYRPAPQPQQYAAPKPRYQQPAQAAYVAAPQENNYGYAPAPSSYNKKPVAILSQDFKLDDYGYKYNYESEDYQKKEEVGKIIPGTKKQTNYGYEEDDGSLQVQGSFSYNAPDGTPISLNYEADENGFRPYGAHLPTAPPLPEALVQAIQEHQQAVAALSQKSYAQAPQEYQPAASYQRPQYSRYQQ